MEVYTCPLGMVQANCYILVKDHACLVIDPGAKFDLDSFLRQRDLHLEGILLTHAHFDHIQGVDALVSAYQVGVYVHESETAFLRSPALNASQSFYETVISQSNPIGFQEGNLQIGSFAIQVLHTPGHSCGSCCFLIEGQLFSGDTLFQGSIGRMDLPTGSIVQMKESLQRLCQLPDDLVVYPGHGPSTTIGQEKQWNYELKSLD